MSIQRRCNVRITGSGSTAIVFAHGFGCDQSMWRLLLSAFAHRYRLVTFDLVGSGQSDLLAYDYAKYATLHGHADDLLDIVDSCTAGQVVLVSHSVSAMIGLLATIKAPDRFVAHIMVGPSPCFINDEEYVGGFNAEDMDLLLQMMEVNFVSWSQKMAPRIMGAYDRPELGEELTARFLNHDRAIIKHFARVTFLSDHRADLPQSSVPTLILACSDDLIVPKEVGQYMRQHVPKSRFAIIDNLGHCPHVSAATATSAKITNFLSSAISQD